MVKCHHDWNSHIETWESDGRVFKQPAKPKIPLMELFGLDFLHFGGRDRAELRGAVSVIDNGGVHTVFSSDRFQTFRVGRFDALTGGDFSRGGRPIDGEYDVCIHTDLEDNTHGELYLLDPDTYNALSYLGEDFLKRKERSSLNEILVWITFPDESKTYDSLYRSQLVGPHCVIDVLFAVYRNAVAATVELTFVESKNDFDPDVRADVCGKMTARNTLFTDPEAYSTLFARTTCEYASLQLGDSVPLSKPSVVVPATSSLLLDLDLEYRVPSGHGINHKFLKTKSSFQVPASQDFQRFVDLISLDTDGAIAMLKVEVKWLKLKP